jgi:subtilisin family serine protease
MNPLSLTRLDFLMKISSGNPKLTIGIIDGPIDLDHPAFKESKITAVKKSQLVKCKNADSMACGHGTFVAGMLCAKRGISAPAICPQCNYLIRPIFNEQMPNKTNSKRVILPQSTPSELSEAIIEVVDAGAKIINLSLGLSESSLMVYHKLQESYEYARKRGVMIVAASGNQGNIGNPSLFDNQWVIPVVSCDENGQFDSTSNFGRSIGNRGVMAPGVDIESTFPGGQYAIMSGTSIATVFVTGAIALLLSIFTNATPGDIIKCLNIGGINKGHTHRSLIPPLLNAESAFQILQNK